MNNLQFRELKKTDLENLRRWRMLPEVTKYLFSDPVLTIESQEQWYEKIKKKGDSLYWIVNFEGVDIGYVVLKDIDERNKRAKPMIYIGVVEYQGKGLGKLMIAFLESYAFERLHLHKLCAYVLSENYPSLISYLKRRWKIEGILKDHIFKCKFHTIYVLALFKEGWVK